MSEYIEFNGELLLHCAVTSSVFMFVVSKVVLFIVFHAKPSRVELADFTNDIVPNVTIEATPGTPVARIVKLIAHTQMPFVMLGIVCTKLSAKTTEPDFILILKVSLFLEEIIPPKSPRKLSPTVNPLAGTLNVPTPPLISVPIAVLVVTGVLFPH
jgi:hypothetical protein